MKQQKPKMTPTYFIKKFVYFELGWHHLLNKWDIHFFLVPEIKKAFTQFYVSTCFSPKTFFSSGKYAWRSSLYNAELIVKNALYYENLYELLVNYPFNENLNLHKSISSLATQNRDLISEDIHKSIIFDSKFYYSNKNQNEYFNSLDMSHWDYSTVIISAICYILYYKYGEQEKINATLLLDNEKLQKQSISFKIEVFFIEIFPYLLHKKFSRKLFSVLATTNIFYSESVACINAFVRCFETINKTKYDFALRYLDKKSLFCFFRVFRLQFIFPTTLMKTLTCNLKMNSSDSTEMNSSVPFNFHALLTILKTYKIFIQKCAVFKEQESSYPKNFLSQQISSDESTIFVIIFFSAFFSFQEDINKVNWVIYWTVHDFHKMFLSLDVETILIKKNKNLQFEKLKDIVSKKLENIGRIGYSTILVLGGLQ